MLRECISFRNCTRVECVVEETGNLKGKNSILQMVKAYFEYEALVRLTLLETTGAP
jgi:hypothetical protein